MTPKHSINSDLEMQLHNLDIQCVHYKMLSASKRVAHGDRASVAYGHISYSDIFRAYGVTDKALDMCTIIAKDKVYATIESH